MSCPRCGGEVKPPDPVTGAWSCDRCGAVDPLHAASHISGEVLADVRDRVRLTSGGQPTVPMWCPWPPLPGWTVTGVGWAGDDRTGVRATAVALRGPAPLQDGPADVVFVAEEMGVGLGAGLAGMPGPDPGPAIDHTIEVSGAHAKVRIGGHPAPLWAVPSPPDRSVHVGEAQGRWLSVITWPASAGYVLVEEIALIDLVESVPAELVFGAPSRRLRPTAPGG